jgi:hypothetical protein
MKILQSSTILVEGVLRGVRRTPKNLFSQAQTVTVDINEGAMPVR